MSKYAFTVTNSSHTLLCSECRQPITGDATTCSPKCRKRRQRRQQEAAEAFTLAMHELQVIRDGIKRGENLTRAIDDLKRLQGEIKDLLLLAGDADSLARQEMFNARAAKRAG
ncbi:MAG: hypothetical protein H0X30_05620 [Anaerolineae bacterium]|nr:hypothetical protein [Anaerolineae bacterium]